MLDRSDPTHPAWLRILEGNQEQLLGVLQSQALLVLDVSARIVFANERSAELLERPLSEVLGAHFLEFMDEEGRELARAYLEHPLSSVEGLPELKLKRVSGADLWVLAHRKAFPTQGPKGCALLILTDVSRLKQAERSAASQCRALLAENARLAELATLDPLTGLLNRRALDERLEQETARARRHAHPLSLLLLDVDRFKQLNDTFGHAAGDAALCAIAKALEAHVRLSDVVARYGGEEFLVIAPHTPPRGAIVLAERLRVAVEECISTTKLTVSIGVAQLRVGESSGVMILARADHALYQAKREGRNRVCLHEEV